MDNNANGTKISLSTFLKAAAVFLVLVGIIISFTVYKIIDYREKLSEQIQSSDMQVSEINSDNQELQNRIDEIDEQVENISNSVAESSDTSGTVPEEEPEEPAIDYDAPRDYTKEDIATNLQLTLDIDSTHASGPYLALYMLGFFDAANDSTVDYFSTEKNSVKNNGYMITVVKYNDFYREIRKYMTDKCFKDNFGEFFINEDGYLTYKNTGASGISYTVKKMTLVKDNQYTADVRFVTEGYDEIQRVDFTIDKNNGTIDSYKFIYDE